MNYYKQILNLFDCDTEESFNKVAINIFRYQATENSVYKRYLELIDCEIGGISHYRDIPLLPISLFKIHNIKTGEWQEQKVFLSSGTQNKTQRSRHCVKDLDWYQNICRHIFSTTSFSIDDTEVLSLLPSYIENADSSLVQMVGHFQMLSDTKQPASFLYNHEKLYNRIDKILKESEKQILLIGVTYALLDFAETVSRADERLSIIFTGGMKNRRKEMHFSEIVAALAKSFPSSQICAEYGMTEMFSQAYSNRSGIYTSPPTLRIVGKEIQDPLSNSKTNKTGILGVIDLANIDTLSFILTEDLVTPYSDHEFYVNGRLDNSDIRGCNLMYQPDYF